MTSAARLRPVLVALASVVFSATAAGAQQLRGTVRDSATRSPLPGVVITLTNGTGQTLARAITNDRGAYTVDLVDGARAVDAIRIGFRPQHVALADGVTLDFTMAPIPPLLEPVTIRASGSCPARADREQALSLLQQARAGLQATVTARETNKAAIKRLRFVRDWDADTKHILEQAVTLDSSGGHSDTFGAVRTGAEFVATGFVDRTTLKGAPIHYGPDAETLLDDDFAAGYCFQIANADRSHPREIGLAFAPASRKRSRVDIEGTLWVDTVANELRDIQFSYVGDEGQAGAPQTGGHIEFRTMGNGMVIVDRWMLRLARVRMDTSSLGKMVVTPVAEDVGGEVATATWDDGFTWHGSLGTLQLVAVDAPNSPARRFILRLKNTDYIGNSRANGYLEIPYLLPGPYVATVVDSASARLGVTMPTTLRFEAQRDSVTRPTFSLPRDDDFILNSCLSGLPDSTEPAPLAMHVLDASGKPAVGAVVNISYGNTARDQGVTESLVVGESGVVRSCLRYRARDAFHASVVFGDAPAFEGSYRTGAAELIIRLRPPNR